MSDVSGIARGAALWVIPLAVVVAALGWETDWGRAVVHAPPEPPATAPQPVAVALLPEYQIEGGVEARRETVDRALFNPTRRPAPPANQAAGANSSLQRNLYTLTGTTVVGNVATAFLREVNGGKSRSVRKGETVNGMVVADVKPDLIRFKQGNDVEELHLKIAPGPKTTIQVAGPVAPAGLSGCGGRRHRRCEPGTAATGRRAAARRDQCQRSPRGAQARRACRSPNGRTPRPTFNRRPRAAHPNDESCALSHARRQSVP